MNILIVEDQKRLADALGAILEDAGYHADVVYDGRNGLDWACAAAYDAVVLDVMLPKLNGFEVVREMRRAGIATPVILLTARDTLRDKVSGLDAGADDYLTKPFQPDELLARLRALTRRQGEVLIESITVGDTTLDLSNALLCCGNTDVRLSLKEFEVCRLLMASKGRVIPKSLLIEKVWGLESAAEDNNVEAYVSFLRKKLTYVGSNLRISTQRMIGYRLEVAEDSVPAATAPASA
ncbi:MAG: response regulator transcription factor [Coriobacteriaceae bacterium]|jgi:DNA-binding response OmpR family regulator|nr:response regulator transcription factor [Coriobacteriaceae bacterium]